MRLEKKDEGGGKVLVAKYKKGVKEFWSDCCL